MSIIAVEGAMGVGKTTVCKILAGKTGFVFVENPLRELLLGTTDKTNTTDKMNTTDKANGTDKTNTTDKTTAIDNIDGKAKYLDILKNVEDKNDKFLSAWFYGAGDIYLGDKYFNKTVITERCLLTNVINNLTKSNEWVLKTIGVKLKRQAIFVILKAEDVTIAKRIRERDGEETDISSVREASAQYDRMLYFCIRNDLKYIVVESDNLTADEIAEKIIEEIEKINEQQTDNGNRYNY